MTGYASAQQNGIQDIPPDARPNMPTSRMGLEIRSVNSRFLDLSFKLPEELRSSEPALREKLGTRLKRGKVELRASLECSTATLVTEPSVRLLQRLNSIQDNVKAWLPTAQALSVAEVIALAVDESGPGHDWSQQVIELTDQVLAALMSAREREGSRLVVTLCDRIAQLRTLVAQAGPLIPQLVAQQRQRFMDRWTEAMGFTDGGNSADAAQDRALTEATAFAIRIDVAGELTRLTSHLDELERLIKQGGEIGKRLDFLIQELHREANTLGSKSAALELTHIAVDMKVLIEQMREQVQNIE